jgi:hypothetical protein
MEILLLAVAVSQLAIAAGLIACAVAAWAITKDLL